MRSAKRIPALFVLCSLFSVFLSVVAPSSAAAVAAAPPHDIPAIFAFGDSTLDPGNNNGILLTFVRANHPPYGINFPHHMATGRFSDGKLVTDFLVSYLGIKDALPAYLDPRLKASDLATGVSFASAGSGLDEVTSATVNVISMDRQMENFRQYIKRLRLMLGEEEASKRIRNSLFVIGTGSNDMMLNYYIIPTRKEEYDPSGYQDFLLKKLESFVHQLHAMGARKFSISGLPPIGCLPLSMTGGFFTPGPNMLHRACNVRQNQDSVAYNDKLRKRISDMQRSLNVTKMAYADIYNPLIDMIKNPKKYGFVGATAGCCGTGLFEMGLLCGMHSQKTMVCPDASKYVFFDAVHPSQAAYKAISDHLTTTVMPKLVSI